MLDTYKSVPVNQLQRYLKNSGIKESTINRALDKLTKGGAYTCKDGFLQMRNLNFSYTGISTNPLEADRIEKGIHKAFVVFMDFVIKLKVPILTHFPSLSFPYIMVFATKKNVYEVIYAEEDEEKIIRALLDHMDRTSEKTDDDTTKRIVIVDDVRQATVFADSDIELFAVVDEFTGKSNYFGGDDLGEND